jgi:hypothetical protein
MISKLANLVSTAATSEESIWSYIDNGKDWPLNELIEGNNCGSTN